MGRSADLRCAAIVQPRVAPLTTHNAARMRYACGARSNWQYRRGCSSHGGGRVKRQVADGRGSHQPENTLPSEDSVRVCPKVPTGVCPPRPHRLAGIENARNPLPVFVTRGLVWMVAWSGWLPDQGSRGGPSLEDPVGQTTSMALCRDGIHRVAGRHSYTTVHG